MSLARGTRVTDAVTLVRPLGRGGMASVWIARHAKLECEVAVKFASAELVREDPSLLTRFRREAALSAQLKSPHVVKTFDHGLMDDGRPYIVMELLRGEALGEHLVRQGRLPPRQVAKVVMQVASVLQEAHGLGVVHRDIKPDNVFLIDAGYALFTKVLDFGIAKQVSLPRASEVTSTGAIVGTPEYMSPEQLLSTGAADHRSDLWSLAVLAYHALVGRVPFNGETLPALSLSICHADFEPPSEACSDLPPEVDAWFARAFAPAPEDRFQSASEMAEALAAILRPDERAAAIALPDPTARRDDMSPPAPDARLPATESATLAAASAETTPRPDPRGARPAWRIAGLIAVGIAVAAGSDLLLRQALRPASLPTGDPLPLASAPLDPWEEEATAAERLTEPISLATGDPPTPPEPAPAPQAPSPPTSTPPRPPRGPTAQKPPPAPPSAPPASSAAPTASARPDCDEPWEIDEDGTMVLKPACM